MRQPTPLERLAAEAQANKRRKHRQGSIALTVVIVVLVGAAGGAIAWGKAHHARWLGYRSAASSPSAAPAAAPSLLNPVNPLAQAGINGPPADPFAGTPADGWRDGADGITIPAAAAHGPYTAAEVRSAYATSRELLVAANLDWPTLRGGYPAAFAKLLPQPERTQFLDNLDKRGAGKDGFPLSTRDLVASFAPGTTRFVTTVVKVSGTMSAGEATASGTRVLRITVNYLFAYAVEPPGSPQDWMRVVAHQEGSIDFAQWDDPGGPLEPWFSASGAVAGDQCTTTDGYIHPAYPHGPPPSVQPSGAPIDPYSLATSAPSTHNGCRRTTGT